MTDKTLPSGAVLKLNDVPWPAAHKLYMSVVRELEVVRVEFGATNLNIQDLQKTQVDDKAINTLKNLMCRLMGSDTVQAALWDCMGRCLYTGQKITDRTFEPTDARGDFLVVEKEVLWHSLLPFLKDLLSLFPPLQALRSINAQK